VGLIHIMYLDVVHELHVDGGDHAGSRVPVLEDEHHVERLCGCGIGLYGVIDIWVVCIYGLCVYMGYVCTGYIDNKGL
jgi:hypothetical protein